MALGTAGTVPKRKIHGKQEGQRSIFLEVYLHTKQGCCCCVGASGTSGVRLAAGLVLQVPQESGLLLGWYFRYLRSQACCWVGTSGTSGVRLAAGLVLQVPQESGLLLGWYFRYLRNQACCWVVLQVPQESGLLLGCTSGTSGVRLAAGLVLQVPQESGLHLTTSLFSLPPQARRSRRLARSCDNCCRLARCLFSFCLL